jgi:acetyl esterase/lipase
MSLIPGFRYSKVAAPQPAGLDSSERLTVDAAAQIPRSPRGVRLHRGVTYRPGLRLDVHTPAAGGRHPLVVYLPGGGFVRASRSLARRERAYVASAGYVVASVEYRTVRQRATYRDALADIHAAIEHLTVHADEYGIDSGGIAVWGESAGGYLASVVGLTEPNIRAVIDLFGASDLRRIADGFDSHMRAAVVDPRHPVQRFGAVDANPIDLIGPSAPAFLLLHGDDDRIIPPSQTLMLHKALRSAGLDSTYRLLAGAGHGPFALNRGQVRPWTSVEVMTIITDFLHNHLRS